MRCLSEVPARLVNLSVALPDKRRQGDRVAHEEVAVRDVRDVLLDD